MAQQAGPAQILKLFVPNTLRVFSAIDLPLILPLMAQVLHLATHGFYIPEVPHP